MLTAGVLKYLKVGEKENQENNFESKSKKPIISPFKNGGMFDGASHLIFENARQLRKNMTAAETVLWMHLKAGINGCKFRRQHPIGLYIADFYCHKASLVIEIDGSIHNLETVKQNDKEKEAYLKSNGYLVLRFTNKEVMTQVEIVLEKIKSLLNRSVIDNNSNTIDEKNRNVCSN